jgi:hypothetical protein
MELNKVEFTVLADDKEAIEIAIKDVNLQSKSDYELVSYKSGEVGLCKISVSSENIKPEFLFMMGKRYEILRKKIPLNFG